MILLLIVSAHAFSYQALVQVENEWCDAAIHRDAARLERIFADDISWLEDVGYRNKPEVMHRYMVEIQEHMWELRDVRIGVIGNMGIVSSHIHVKKTTAGNLTESDHTSARVMVLGQHVYCSVGRGLADARA